MLLHRFLTITSETESCSKYAVILLVWTKCVVMLMLHVRGIEKAIKSSKMVDIDGNLTVRHPGCRADFLDFRTTSSQNCGAVPRRDRIYGS